VQIWYVKLHPIFLILLCSGQLEEQSWEFWTKYIKPFFLNCWRVRIPIRANVKFPKLNLGAESKLHAIFSADFISLSQGHTINQESREKIMKNFNRAVFCQQFACDRYGILGWVRPPGKPHSQGKTRYLLASTFPACMTGFMGWVSSVSEMSTVGRQGARKSWSGVSLCYLSRTVLAGNPVSAGSRLPALPASDKCKKSI
jgi:hypothetical protein